MSDGIKKVLDPALSKTALLRSSCGEMIIDRNKKMEKWVGHYTEFYSSETIVISSSLDDIKSLPSMDELDAKPTLDELITAIDNLVPSNTPSNDGISPKPDQVV